MTHAVLDLAGKFADGTLSTKKLLEADDEELHKILTAVRGIGTVSVLLVVVGNERLIIKHCLLHASGLVRLVMTRIRRKPLSALVVDMFAIFSLRRPDILPVGM